MKNSKALTWDDLANEYKKATGNSAYIRGMDPIFSWAEKQTDKFYVDHEKQTIHKVVKSRLVEVEGGDLNENEN